MLIQKLFNRKSVSEIKCTIATAVVLRNETPEVLAARANLMIAGHDFENASQLYVDAAIHNLIAAEERYAAVIAENVKMIPDHVFDADKNTIRNSVFRKLTVGQALKIYTQVH